MSAPQNQRSSFSHQESVAVLAQQILDLKERSKEDRDDYARDQAQRIAMRAEDRRWIEENFVPKTTMKPILALFWAVVSAIILGLVSAGMAFLVHTPKS